MGTSLVRNAARAGTGLADHRPHAGGDGTGGHRGVRSLDVVVEYAGRPVCLAGLYPGDGVSIIAPILLTIVVVQAPAVLAGSLAGERERGVLQLLLTTAVTPREIVSGRLLGKLSQVGMIVLAGVPIIALLAAWNGLSLLEVVTLFLLMAAVGLGGGGLAVGASVISRRGRERTFECLYIDGRARLEPTPDQSRFTRRDWPMAGGV